MINTLEEIGSSKKSKTVRKGINSRNLEHGFYNMEYDYCSLVEYILSLNTGDVYIKGMRLRSFIFYNDIMKKTGISIKMWITLKTLYPQYFISIKVKSTIRACINADDLDEIMQCIKLTQKESPSLSIRE